MRLKPEHVTSIRDVFKRCINSTYKLYLYGSRTDKTLKGGDIDLLVLTSEAEVDAVFSKKYSILAEIKKHIGEQRIDLLIKSTTDDDHFIQEALRTGVLLDERTT